MTDSELQPCRICKKPYHRTSILAHARSAHPVEWSNWLASKIAFGMSIYEHCAIREVDKAVIRQ